MFLDSINKYRVSGTERRRNSQEEDDEEERWAIKMNFQNAFSCSLWSSQELNDGNKKKLDSILVITMVVEILKRLLLQTNRASSIKYLIFLLIIYFWKYFKFSSLFLSAHHARYSKAKHRFVVKWLFLAQTQTLFRGVDEKKALLRVWEKHQSMIFFFEMGSGRHLTSL